VQTRSSGLGRHVRLAISNRPRWRQEWRRWRRCRRVEEYPAGRPSPWRYVFNASGSGVGSVLRALSLSSYRSTTGLRCAGMTKRGEKRHDGKPRPYQHIRIRYLHSSARGLCVMRKQRRYYIHLSSHCSGTEWRGPAAADISNQARTDANAGRKTSRADGTGDPSTRARRVGKRWSRRRRRQCAEKGTRPINVCRHNVTSLACRVIGWWARGIVFCCDLPSPDER